MRIRKRQVPLPLSSLLPVPLSDLYFNRSPTTTASYFCGQDRDGVLASLLHLPQPPVPVSDGQQRDVMNKNQEKALDDDGVKSSSTDASGSKNVNPAGESDSSTQVVEKNENVVTLRKRRGFISFEDEEEEEEAIGGGRKGKKKAKKSGALEEGSRCSRVNGRGWRCCQQTLYGYSLCEHHLGKGRVRSMNKSAGRREKKTVVVEVKNKRVKLGMVKARSISSLLGQASTSSGIADVLVDTESEISAHVYQSAASDNLAMDGRFWSYDSYACNYHIHASCVVNKPKPVDASAVEKCGAASYEGKTVHAESVPGEGSETEQTQQQPAGTTGKVEDPALRQQLELQKLQLQLDMSSAYFV